MMRMVMKMAAASTLSLLLLCCFSISFTAAQGGCDYSKATGENFTVPLGYKLDKSDKLKWMHDNEAILYIRDNNFVVGKKEDVYANGSLILTNLKKSDAGKYTPEVFGSDGVEKVQQKSIHLCILDHAPEPKVKIECLPTSVRFTCEVPAKAANLNFEWLQNKKVLEKEKMKSLTRKAREVPADSFSCKVSNRVSSMTSAPVTQTCYTPSPVFPEKLLGINTWIFVGVGGGIVLVLIVVVIVCCIRTRRRKRMQLKEEGELRLAWTNEQQHQHNHPPHHPHPHPHPHPHHHHHQQQPAGHTGPRQQRSKQHRDQQRPRAPDLPGGHPQPSSRRPAQAPRPVAKIDDEQPPPLPQPRKKAPRTQRV